MTNFERVQEFHRAFGQRRLSIPGIPDAALRKLRDDLIDEERDELKLALDAGDVVKVADALADILYVVYGTADTYGIPIDACFREVHRSNMAKLDENGKPIKRADGKFLKPPGWTPPDIAGVLGIKKGN
mgnify:CR=1 FL=1